MRTGRLELDAAKVVLGLLPSTEFSGIAVRALEDGYDCPSLRTLAGLTASQADEAGVLFERVLSEFAIPTPSKRDAVLHLAREIAKGILSGATGAHEGAKQISTLSRRASDDTLSELDTFVYAESEWDERPGDRRIFEDGIMAAAEELAAQRQS